MNERRLISKARPDSTTHPSLFIELMIFTLFFGPILGLEQNEGEGRKIFHMPSVLTFLSPTIKILHCSGTMVALEEPTLTFHHRSEFIVHIGIHSWCCIVYGFGQCIVTWIHYYSNRQSNFTALTSLCASPIHLFFLPGLW